MTHPDFHPEDTVIVGAGGLGRKVARALGKHVVAFVDNNPAKLDQAALPPVLSISEAVRRYPDARFTVAIWGANSDHRILKTEAQLSTLGIWRITPVGRLLAEHGLTHYWLTNPAALEREQPDMHTAADLWHDPLSRATYAEQLSARLLATPTYLSEPVSGPAYWRHELVRFSPRDIILDGGAFDGDSLRSYLATFSTPKHWLAIEPDPTTYLHLSAYSQAQRIIRGNFISTLNAALGARLSTTTINPTGSHSTTTGTGIASVPVTTIDALHPGHRIDFIKLDIEGDEMPALSGAWARIAKDRPALAISVYHKPNDLWRIPLAIHAHCSDYRFHLRAHGPEGWDLVCYAIPPEKCP